MSDNIKCLHQLVHGDKLKSYSFDKYLTKNSQMIDLNILSQKKVDLNLVKKFSAIEKELIYKRILYLNQVTYYILMNTQNV